MMVFIAILETVFYSINFHVIFSYLGVKDIGGGMNIHQFGAYFGLTATLILSPREKSTDKRYADGIEPTYVSDLFAMIGTVFLWIYWPSFNAVLAVRQAQLMAVVNTLLSLCGATFTVAVMSRWLRGGNRMHMVDIQNATLAGALSAFPFMLITPFFLTVISSFFVGGVAMGVFADTPLNPGVAVACGIGAGIISVFGFAVLQVCSLRLLLFDLMFSFSVTLFLIGASSADS
jgi:ammonium transporter Rh